MYSELWKEIPDKSGYFVSTHGRVWSGRSDQEVGYIGSQGYPIVSIEQKTYYIHTLILETFIGPRPSEKHQCRHLNDVKTDNYLDNLVWGTSKENSKDSIDNNTIMRGSRHYGSCFCETCVIVIRKLYAQGNYTQKELADLFGIKSRQTVSAIVRGENWKHVGGPITKNRIPESLKEEISNKHKKYGVSQYDLAKEFGVSQSSISRIINENK